MELVTTDKILAYLKECVEHKVPVDAHVWLDAAQKLTILLEEEHDKLFDLEQKVAITKSTLLQQGKTVAAAKVMVEASDAFKEARKQKAKIERIIEMVRISKIQSRLKDDYMAAL